MHLHPNPNEKIWGVPSNVIPSQGASLGWVFDYPEFHWKEYSTCRLARISFTGTEQQWSTCTEMLCPPLLLPVMILPNPWVQPSWLGLWHASSPEPVCLAGVYIMVEFSGFGKDAHRYTASQCILWERSLPQPCFICVSGFWGLC